jgi:hypothetical protein
MKSTEANNISQGTISLKDPPGSKANSSEPINDPTSEAGSKRTNQGLSDPISCR